MSLATSRVLFMYHLSNKVTPSNGALSLERKIKRPPSLLNPLLFLPVAIVIDLLANSEADVVGVADAAEGGEAEAAHVQRMRLATSVRVAYHLLLQMVLPLLPRLPSPPITMRRPLAPPPQLFLVRKETLKRG